MTPPKSGPAAAAVAAIQTGDVRSLEQLLAEHPELVNQRIDGQRTLLHTATDWPGHFPNIAATVAALISSGAAVSPAFIGRHSETPLHWAASSNDVAAMRVLLDHGAEIEAPGAVIGGGTALADAVAFGQWDAARLLIDRGAAANLWQAAALGLMDRVTAYFATGSPPDAAEVTKAFWCACFGGQQLVAQYLLGHGADVNWVGYDRLTALDAARRRGDAAALVEWLRGAGAKSVTELA